MLYLAGKYSDPEPSEVQRNINYAVKNAAKLIKKGHTVIIPHTLYDERIEREIGYEAILKMDFDIILYCEAVVLLDNWINSPGAKREVKHALSNGIKVYDSVDEVPDKLEVIDCGWNSKRCAHCCETTRRFLSGM